MKKPIFSVSALLKGLVIIGVLIGLAIIGYRWWPRQYETFDLSSIKAIDTGAQHSLILLNDGALWGVGDGQFQQLGITGSSPFLTKRNSYTGDKYTNRPVKIMDGVVQGEAGLLFSLALKSDHTLWGFGYNVDYEFSMNTGSTTENPGTAPIKIMDDVIQIASGGGLHSLVVKQDGSLWGIGRNLFGPLGMMKNSHSYEGLLAPEKIMDGVKQVFAGTRNTFVLKTDGSLWSMGRNIAGELGFPPEQETNYVPRKIFDGATMVAAYEDHTLILAQDGTVWGTGENSSGQLGLPEVQVHTPTRITDNAQGVAVGRAHSLILKKDGSLWGLGDNTSGQLGLTGVEQVKQLTKLAENVKAAYAAADHTLVLTSSGDVLAWGSNQSGQIGLPGFFLEKK